MRDLKRKKVIPLLNVKANARLPFCSFWTKKEILFTSEVDEGIVWLVGLGGFFGCCCLFVWFFFSTIIEVLKLGGCLCWFLIFYVVLLGFLLFSEGSILILSLFVKTSLI